MSWHFTLKVAATGLFQAAGGGAGNVGRRGERVAGNHRVAELAEKIADGAGGMRDEHRVGSVVGGDFFQRVEILGYQDELHNVVRRGARHSFGKILNGIFQSGDDRSALISDAFALQALGLGFRFSLFDGEELVGFGAGHGGLAFPLCGVDIVHGGFHFGVGNDVGDEHFNDVVAVFVRVSIVVVAAVLGKVVLVEESVGGLH